MAREREIIPNMIKEAKSVILDHDVVRCHALLNLHKQTSNKCTAV